MKIFIFEFGILQVIKGSKELAIHFIQRTGITKEELIEEIKKSGYSVCYFCINPETLQYWVEPVKTSTERLPQSGRERLMINLYGQDSILMNPLRTKVFKSFLDIYKSRYDLKPHFDGYMGACLFCSKDKLLINKVTGTTYCYNCKRELPFEYLFETLKGLDIQSIVQDIRLRKRNDG